MKALNLDAQREQLDALPRRSYSPALVPLVFTGVAGIGVVAVYMSQGPGKAWWLGSIAAVVLTVWVVLLVRRYLRNRLVDDLITNLARELGWAKPGRLILQCSRWKGFFRGYPSKILARHTAKEIPDDLAWHLKLKTEIRRFLPDVSISINAHPRKHLLLVIRCVAQAPTSADEEETDTQVQNVAEIVGALFGEDARVQMDQNPETMAPVKIEVTHSKGNEMALVSRRSRVERVVAARLPGEWRPKWDLVNATVTFSQRAPLPTLVTPGAEHQPRVQSHADYMELLVPFGETENGEVVGWRPKNQPHMLVVGPTGAGKTTIEHQVIERLAQAGCRIWLCDGKRVEFMGFRNWPNVELIAAKTEHKAFMVRAFYEEMNRRYDLIESGQVRISDLEPIFMVVDEAATLVTQVNMWFAEIKPKGARSSKSPLMDYMGDVARLGRTAKMHMLVGLQRPDVRFLDGEMRDNFACRASAGKLGADGAQMMWDNPRTGAAASPVPGRGWAMTSDGRIVETQFSYAPNPDPSRDEYEPAKVAAVMPSETIYTAQHIEVLDPDPVDLDGEPVLYDFNDYMGVKILDGPDPNWGTPNDVTTTEPDPNPEPEEPTMPTTDTIENAEATSDEEPNVLDPAADTHDTQVLQLDPVRLTPGDLALVDEALDLWAVIDNVHAEDTGVVLDYRMYDTGEPESMTVDDSDTIPTRRPLPTDENS
ncbi:MAG: FtsK/SpoIIIE domain-containing protein [Galactobacter sp.]